MKYKSNQFIQFNPAERLYKGAVAKKIAMEHLGVFARRPQGFTVASFSGGLKFRNGDTLLARITPCLENGKTAFVNILDSNEVAFGSTEYIVMRAVPNLSLPLYVYYLSVSNNFRAHAIKSMTGTSGRQRIQQAKLEELEFDLPDLVTQQHIVDLMWQLSYSPYLKIANTFSSSFLLSCISSSNSALTFFISSSTSSLVFLLLSSMPTYLPGTRE